MKILKSYQFRLNPTEKQISDIKQHGGNIRFVWNKLLEFSNESKKINDKYPKQSELQKYILKLKTEHEFIKISHSQPIQINAKRLAETFVKAFKPKTISERNKKIAKAHQIVDPIKKETALEKALNFGFPKFKRKNRCHDSIFYPQYFFIKNNQISFPKLGWINFIKHREIEGKLKTATITQDGNKYFVSLSSEIEIQEKEKINIEKANIIGIDVGIKTFAVFSDGTEIKNPRTLKHHLKKLKREQRKTSKRQLISTGEIKFEKEVKVSSNNRTKQIEKVCKIHRKIKNIRKDFLHKTTHNIITKYDGVVLENLDIKEMQSKSSKAMNRCISDVSWYEFGRLLDYKAFWNSKYYIKIDRYFPSTQLCNKCGNISHLSLKERTYNCQSCESIFGRDLNASMNIRDEGIRLIKNTLATKGIDACGKSSKKTFVEARKVVIEPEEILP